MGRCYSRDGCTTCKRRKKKCDGARPVCDACSRLDLACTYQEQSSKIATKTRSQTAIKTAPIQIARAPRFYNNDSETEWQVLSRAEHAILSFYTPAASERTRDLHEIWQLIYSDDLVRHAVVTCFSSILGQETETYSFNRQSFGRALQSLRIRLARRQIGASENISLRTSITYIGLMDVGSTSELPACVEVINAFASVLDRSGVMIRLDIGEQVHICS